MPQVPHSTITPVHPHVCGEYLEIAVGDQPLLGSPPRVWGIRPVQSRPVRSRPVHPHVCGEYIRRKGRADWFFGSPPRVWGILISAGTYIQNITVHPHVCGEYGNPVDTLERQAVHPHVCGEYALSQQSIKGKSGSPPRVWGILHRISQWPIAIRFTPTCVGNTKPI